MNAQPNHTRFDLRKRFVRARHRAVYEPHHPRMRYISGSGLRPSRDRVARRARMVFNGVA